MTSRILDKSDDQLLIEFLNSSGEVNPSILGYHYPVYRDMLAHIQVGEPCYFGAFDNNELVGVLPGFIKKSEVGSVYSSMPFFGPNAGVLVNREKDAVEIHQAIFSGLSAHLDTISDLLTASFYTPFLSKDYELYESALGEVVQVDKFTQYLNLEESKWDSKINYDIRKALRLGVTISEEVTDKNIDDFYAIYLQNCIDYSIPVKPRECVDFLQQNRNENVAFSFAFQEGVMIGGLIMIYGPETASYYIPCSLASARTLQPNTILIDHAVQEAKKRGIKYWNWESSPSTDSGVFQFKKKWSSIDDTYRIYVKLYCDKQTIKDLGQEKIAAHFPYFFVYPFNRL